MKIWMQIPSVPFGGTVIQANMMKELYEKYDSSVCLDDIDDLSGYDLAIVTHLYGGMLPAYQKCKKYNVPFIIKPIWVDPLQNNLSSSLTTLIRDSLAIAPESPAEMTSILKYVKGLDNKFFLTQPAVDKIYQCNNPLDNRKLVMLSGTYIPLKNHHLVLKACKELNLPVVTCGYIFDKNYYKSCEAIGYGDMRDCLNKYDQSVLFNEARVYVCASEFEVCSTSVSEAIACGCRVVSTERNLGNSNFSKEGYFTFKHNFDSLKVAIKEAYYGNSIQKNEIWRVSKLFSLYKTMISGNKGLFL